MSTIASSADIHPTAIIAEGAQIGEETIVGPYSVIGPDVVIGSKNCIKSHVVIEGHTTIGDANTIYQFASVGSMPQDLKYRGEPSTLEIGNQNTIREYATLQPGTEGGGMQTIVGDQNLFMVCSHVGHDGKVGDGNVFANSCALAGHVEVGNGAIIAGLVGIHQFVRIGDLSMVGAGSMVNKDVPPFCIAQGDRACLVGINSIGMKRKGYSSEQISRIKKVYRELFVADSDLSFSDRLAAVGREHGEASEAEGFLGFISGSTRGTAPVRKNETEVDIM